MLNEEKIIDGVLCYRTTPNEEYKPYSPEVLTEEITTLKENLVTVHGLYEALKNRIRVINRAATDYTIEYNYNGDIVKK